MLSVFQKLFIAFIIYLVPVSYTHLDVYKRQVSFDRAEFVLRVFYCIPSFRVSHLHGSNYTTSFTLSFDSISLLFFGSFFRR